MLQLSIFLIHFLAVISGHFLYAELEFVVFILDFVDKLLDIFFREIHPAVLFSSL